jgi:hypothetical protein
MLKSTNNDYEVLTILLEYSLLLEYSDDISIVAEKGLKHFLKHFENSINKDLDEVFKALSMQDKSNTFTLLLKDLREFLLPFHVEQAAYYLIIDMKRRLSLTDRNQKLDKLTSFLKSYKKHLIVQFPKLDENYNLEFFNLSAYTNSIK